MKDIDVVMPINSLIKYSDNFSKTSWSLWQYYRDKPSGQIVNSKSFIYKIKITGKTSAAGNVKGVKILVPLKCLSNF